MRLPPDLPDHATQPPYPTTTLQPTDDLVRFVESDAWLLWGDDGKPKMQSIGIPVRDLKDKGRAVSVTRLQGANREFLSWRATARNKQPEWRDDPVYAVAKVGSLLQILATGGGQELLVYLDPDHDWLGPNDNHVSVVRTRDSIARLADKKTRDEVMAWQVLRVTIADAFSVITHCSGLEIRPLNQA